MVENTISGPEAILPAMLTPNQVNTDAHRRGFARAGVAGYLTR